MNSIFGAIGEEGMSYHSIRALKTILKVSGSAQNSSLLKLFVGILLLSGFSLHSQGQCLKSGSTCNLTTIRNTLTSAGAIELGCAPDSCGIYFLNPNTISADSAENYAQTFGAHLASIGSQAENDSLVKWLIARGDTGSVWIGFTDNITEGRFVWTDGADTTFKNWGIGKPNGGASKDYVSLQLYGSDSTKWNDTLGTTNLMSVIKVSLCLETQTSGNDTVCVGDSASFYASATFGSGNYSYSWSNSSTSDTIKVSPATTTTFRITITDRYSCSAIDSAIMQIDTLPTFSMGDSARICEDSSITLDAGAGSYSYRWHTGLASDTTQTFGSQGPGTYWCIKTDLNGCSYTDTFKLYTDTLPYFSLRDDTTLCIGDTITYTSPYTSTGYTWRWHDNSTAPSYTVTDSAHVKLEIWDGNGCSFYDSAFVFRAIKPNYSLQADTTICEDKSFRVKGLNSGLKSSSNLYASHQWIIYQDTLTDSIISIDTNGTYYYFGRDTNLCPMRDTFVVSFDTLPAINIGNDTNICQFDTLTLDAGRNYQRYQWSTGDTTRTTKGYTASGINVLVTDFNGCVSSDIMLLGIDTLPIVGLMHLAGPGDTSICTNDSIWVWARSDSSVEYSWNGSPFMQYDDSLIVKTAGTVTVELRDTNTCTNKDSLVVSLDTLPIVNLTPDTTICVGDSIWIYANYSPHYQYIWNNLSLGNTDSLHIKQDTSYWVMITDTNTTCKNRDTMSLSHDTLPIIDLGVDTSFCINDSIILDAGANYAHYAWNTADTSRTLTINTPNTYVVSVVDSNGCKGEDSRIIGMNQLPTPNLGPDKEFCQGTPVNEVLDPGGGYQLYDWSGGPTGDSTAARRKTVTNQGTFTVTVTDFNGCQAADTLVINANFLPRVDLGPDTSFCAGDKFNFIANAGPGFVRYEWFENKFGAPLITLPSTGQILLIQDSSSTIICRITDINGCQNQDTMRVIELQRPIVTFTTTRYCEAEAPTFSEVVDADPAMAYQSFKWSTGDSSRSITATESGQYTVTVTSSNGCETTETKNIIEIPKPEIDFSADTLICKGSTVKLEGFNEEYTTYWWYKVLNIAGVDDELINPEIVIGTDTIQDTTASSIEIKEPGTYKLVTRYFQDPFCRDSGITTIREDIRPTIDFGIQAPDTSLCVGETLRLSSKFKGSSSAQVVHLWSDGSTDSILNATSSGLYTLTLTNDCGTEIDEVFVQFEDCSNIWIPSAFTPNGDGDNDRWAVRSQESFLEYRLQVYDRMGHIIWETNLPGVEWDGTHIVNGTPMPNGTYIYKLSYRSNYELIDDVNSAPTKIVLGEVNLFR